MALSAPTLAPLRTRRSSARASRARVTSKASLPGWNSPNREAEQLAGKPGRLVAATLASLLMVRPNLLFSCPGSWRRVMQRPARRKARC